MEQKWSECKIHNKKKEKGSKKGEYSKTKLARIPIAMEDSPPPLLIDDSNSSNEDFCVPSNLVKKSGS